MIEYSSLEAIKTEKEKREICSQCNGETCHEILAGFQLHADNSAYESWDEYAIIKCKGCGSLSFFNEQTFLQADYLWDEETGKVIDGSHKEKILYPRRLAGQPVLEDAESLPKDVHKIYMETHTALCGDQLVLAGIGIRTIIEAVCIERHTRGNDLEEKIDNLAKQNLITENAAQILHGLRFIGNNAAHAIKAHTLAELCIAMGIAKHLLMEVYLIPLQAQKLSTRPNKNSSIPSR